MGFHREGNGCLRFHRVMLYTLMVKLLQVPSFMESGDLQTFSYGQGVGIPCIAP